MAEPKTQKNSGDVAAFIAAVEDEQKKLDCHTLIELMQSVTGSPPSLWGTSIVGFGSYHYLYASGREGDWPLCDFSPRKQALTLYIMPGFSRYDELMSKLGKHKTGKSCLYIKKLDDVDTNVLKELVKFSVEYMRTKYEFS